MEKEIKRAVGKWTFTDDCRRGRSSVLIVQPALGAGGRQVQRFKIQKPDRRSAAIRLDCATKVEGVDS